MLKVDTVYGNDDEQDNDRVFKTLNKAITVSKSGDTILLPPGIFESFNISSKTTNFELKIVGSGNNSVCGGAVFTGFFDFIFDSVKCDSLEIRTSVSQFIFRDVKFVSLNVMELYAYEDIPINSLDETQKTTYITFERCRFDHNFQIILKDGDYVLSFIECQFIGKVPLIYAKKGFLKVNLTNVNFENTLLKNDKAIVEYSHVTCNFPPDIPFYVGSECTNKSREVIQSSHTLFDSSMVKGDIGRSRSMTMQVMGSTPSENSSDTSIEYQKEFYGAISFSSNNSEKIQAHRYTRLINNTGDVALKVLLPDEADNGHQIVIISEKADIIIGTDVYREPCVVLGFIHDYGWIKYPLQFLPNLLNVVSKDQIK